MGENFKNQESENFHEPLNTEISFLGEYQGELTVRFGNSGVNIHLLNRQDEKWDLHFIPESRQKSSKGLADDTMKYSRMFAVGMLALIEFLRELDIEKLEKPVRSFFEAHPLVNITFTTNQKMLTFAEKTLGIKYFTFIRSAPTQEDNSKYLTTISINLEQLLSDVKDNPQVLVNLLKFADPEKIAQINVLNPWKK